jgi:uncharacterized protein DUF397
MDLINAHWRKSSYSGNNGGQCVAVAANLPGVVAVRDSKSPDAGTLTFSPKTWQTFVQAIKNSELSSRCPA